MVRILSIVLVAAATLGSARGGTQYAVACSDKRCGFTTGIGIGGGRMFEQASGYCHKCEESVSVTWKRGSKNLPPHIRFWDPFSGIMREIFDCPKCKGPFMKLDQIEDFRHCPKCGKESLKSKRTVLYD